MSANPSCLVPSPLGDFRVVASEEGVVAADLPGRHGGPASRAGGAVRALALLDQAAAELCAYFAGRRRSFETPLAPRGTAFQRAVWSALATIPFGEVRSYSDLARLAGRPGAARAAGAANGRNPLSIFLPCHRVIGSDGSLTGYAGGLAAKRWLLDHEAGIRQLPSITSPLAPPVISIS
jgi:methylated-DNA-[protein]-cysteine S-methyltransferase